MEIRLTSRLRSLRTTRGLSQERLADRVGLSRQGYAAIEAGASVPGTDVALRLARELGTTVEALFRLPEAPVPEAEAVLVGPSPPSAGPFPVRTARVGGRLHAYPVVPGGGAGLESPDGTARMPEEDPPGGGTVRVAPLPGEEELLRPASLVAAGCDPAFPLMADHLRRERGVEVLWLTRSSRSSLELLAAGAVHVAGLHLAEAGEGVAPMDDPHDDMIRRMVPFPCIRVAWCIWSQELLLAPGNRRRIGSLEGLTRRGVRFLNREPGSGSRRLVERRLAEAGIPAEAVRGFHDAPAGDHLTVARALAAGWADAGVAIRAAGAAFGLEGIPLGEERYDLVIPRHFLDLPAVGALLDALRLPALQGRVEALGGYDLAGAGVPA